VVTKNVKCPKRNPNRDTKKPKNSRDKKHKTKGSKGGSSSSHSSPVGTNKQQKWSSIYVWYRKIYISLLGPKVRKKEKLKYTPVQRTPKTGFLT
jgi:hypothetical protein